MNKPTCIVTQHKTIRYRKHGLIQFLLVQCLQIAHDKIEISCACIRQRCIVHIDQFDRMVLWLRINLAPYHMENCAIEQRLIAGVDFRPWQACFHLKSNETQWIVIALCGASNRDSNVQSEMNKNAQTQPIYQQNRNHMCGIITDGELHY